MSSGAEIDEAVEEIVADRLRVDRSAFDDATPFEGETLDADSLDVVETAEAIDAALDVYLPDEALADVETVGDLKSSVRERAE
ncbi:MAG: acyl carrier protein [Haloferacaceae archaeon]